MKVKAISLWQPWASLIAVGAKKYETRSWATSYRGPLLICAAKKWPPYPGFTFFDNLKMLEPLQKGQAEFNMPRGQAVAIVDLVDTFKCGPHVFQCSDDRDMVARERLFGDFSPGRYAWKLENVRAIKPFPVKGRQGLFEVEIDPCILESAGEKRITPCLNPCST